MKVSTIFVTILASATAFAPSKSVERSSCTSLNAESRRSFINAAIASAAFIPSASFAGTMAQEYVADPTEQWESGSPTESAEKLRQARFTNARSQMTSSFPPIKRLTLERKSPVTRLDINYPSFEAYKKTYPGLFKTLEEAKKE